MKLRYTTTRRRFLRGLGLGAGATLMAPIADRLVGRALAAPTAPSKRVFLMSVYMMEPVNYVPSGFEPYERSAIAPVTVPEWPPMFDRLGPYRQQMAFVDGMRNHIGTTQHRAGTSALSCVNPTDDKPERLGPAGAATIDQVLAHELSRGRPHGSMLWGITGDAVSSGASRQSGVFAAGRAQNLSHFTDSAELMQAVFPDAGVSSAGPSESSFRPLRDRLVADLGRLRSRLAPEERLALDRYEAAILDFDERQAALAAVTCSSPPEVTPPEDTLTRAEAHLRSFMSQSTLALQCGLTNVVAATIGTSNSHNLHTVAYEEMRARYDGPEDGPGFMGHGGTDDVNGRAMITRRLWHETHFREIRSMMDALAAAPAEDDGSVMDHTAVVYVSGNAECRGGHHAPKVSNYAYWPGLVIAGRSTGLYGGGRYLKFRNHHRGDGEYRNLADFYRSIAWGLGVDPGDFGGELREGRGRMDEILV